MWAGLLQHMKTNGLKYSTLRETVIGGSACPGAMIEAFEPDYGVAVVHAWGMTEPSPLGSMCRLNCHHASLAPAQQLAVKVKQGRPVFGIGMKIIDANGQPLPHDGAAYGERMVRGPWAIERYFKDSQSVLQDGWFATGEVATIEAAGYIQITDRSKDVIKSSDEWIRWIDLENITMAHAAVLEADIIGVAHPKSTNALCSSSCDAPATRSRANSCSPTTREKSPGGGFPTMRFLYLNSHIPQRASY